MNLGPHAFIVPLLSPALAGRLAALGGADERRGRGDMADLGTGFIDFATVFAAHRIEEYIGENDKCRCRRRRSAGDYLRGLRC